jgi:hypothetical protein
METKTLVEPPGATSTVSPIQKAGCVDAAEVEASLGTPSAGLTSQEAARFPRTKPSPRRC